MPIYEYHCPKCGTFETMQRITEPSLKRCPTCKSKVERMISNTSFVLKGTGWYATDYARPGSKSNDAAGDKPGDNSSDKPSGESAGNGTNGSSSATASSGSSDKTGSPDKTGPSDKVSSSSEKSSKSKASD
jgi:putative FmdB family regulatory protein